MKQDLPMQNGASRHVWMRTTCGRDLEVGRLSLGDAERPAYRVTVHIGECEGCDDSAWASLTAAEARRLATVLLAEAAAAESGDKQARARGHTR